MDYADFVHLARTSEQACAENGRAYRRSVMWFAALGYLWIVGCVALAVALLAFSVPQLLGGKFKFAWVMLVFAALGLLWASAQALWVRLDDPIDGVRLTPADAPELFKSLDRIRRRINGPPIHDVYLNDDFNAGVQQVQRWGVLGGSSNRLVIGLPLMMSLDKPRFLAVLAHEYGHLHGDHNRLNAWVYRTRLSWFKLYRSMGDSASPFAVATQAFLRWYSPRFVARSFAMARQNEYEADQVAARLLGREQAISALIENQVKSSWFQSRFWQQHWLQAVREPLPVGPYGTMQRLMAQPPEPEYARGALRAALQEVSSVDDTHPVLRDRVSALGEERPALPEQWSTRGSLSLLGRSAGHWIDHFDRDWCKHNADEWKRHHARLQRARARVLELQAGGATRSVGELVETADLMRQLRPGSAAAATLYQQALERDPAQPDALIGLAQGTQESDYGRCLQYLERLWSHHATHRLWAARMALSELETPRPEREFPEQALKLWRERRREGENAEAEVMQELERSPLLESARPHDLSAFERAELLAELERFVPVRRAWVLRKQLDSMPDRRTLVVLVSLSRSDEAAKRQLCAELEQRIALRALVLVAPAEDVASKEQLARLAGDPIHVRSL